MMLNQESEYVVALCHDRNGEIAPYESACFHAIDTAEAVRIADEWALSIVEFIAEPTWLQVNLGGRAVHGLRRLL